MSALEEYEAKKCESLYAVTAMSVVWLADAAIESLKCCGNCGHHREGEEPYEGIWMDCQAWEKGDVSTVAQMPSSPCFFTPSRWQEGEQ